MLLLGADAGHGSPTSTPCSTSYLPPRHVWRTLHAGVTARLVFRQNGLVENWKDPTVNAVYVAGECVQLQRPTAQIWGGSPRCTGSTVLLGRPQWGVPHVPVSACVKQQKHQKLCRHTDGWRLLGVPCRGHQAGARVLEEPVC